MLFYLLVGIPVFLMVLLAVVARLEKRMVWPYSEPEPQPQSPDISGYYGTQWLGEALNLGFSFLGWASDRKGPQYKINYALLVSQQRDCFVIIGIGTIFNMTLRGTWIYTRVGDDKLFYSTDNQSCVEIDVSRQWRSQLAPVRTFPDLLQRHRDWLASRGVVVKPFTPGREAEEFRRVREEHFQAMSRNGLISFTDPSATHWRYTFWGGLKLAALNFSIGLLRAITFGRIPRTA
jgi:hypothetical protein